MCGLGARLTITSASLSGAESGLKKKFKFLIPDYDRTAHALTPTLPPTTTPHLVHTPGRALLSPGLERTTSWGGRSAREDAATAAFLDAASRQHSPASRLGTHARPGGLWLTRGSLSSSS